MKSFYPAAAAAIIIIILVRTPFNYVSAVDNSPITYPETSPSPKPGDIDSNGEVDIFDYNQLLSDYGKTGANLPADLDNDGKVGIFDYNLLLTNFGK